MNIAIVADYQKTLPALARSCRRALFLLLILAAGLTRIEAQAQPDWPRHEVCVISGSIEILKNRIAEGVFERTSSQRA